MLHIVDIYTQAKRPPKENKDSVRNTQVKKGDKGNVETANTKKGGGTKKK